MQNRSNFDDFEITELDAKKYIRLGIKGELEFEVMNNQKSQYQTLDERQLNEIYSHHPKKIKVRLTDGHFNEQRHTFDSFSYEQYVDYKDLWFDSKKFKLILKRYPLGIKGESIHDDLLQKSPYWQELTKIATRAIQYIVIGLFINRYEFGVAL